MALETIKRNNTILTEEIEDFKATIYNEAIDYPDRVDSVYFKNLDKITTRARKLKDKPSYDLIFKDLKVLVQNKYRNTKIGNIESIFEFKPIEAEDSLILKNNSLFTLRQIYSFEEHHLTSGCRMPSTWPEYPVVPFSSKDSVTLGLFAKNRFTVIIDSIVDSNNKRLHFKFIPAHTSLGQVKYKAPHGKTKFYGKLFFQNEMNQSTLLTNYEEVINNK